MSGSQMSEGGLLAIFQIFIALYALVSMAKDIA